MNLVRRLAPDQDDVVDLAFVVALLSLAITGWGSTFSGREEIWTGLPSVAIGIAVGFAIYKFRVGPVPALVVAVVVFFVAGAPLAVPDFATFGVLPNLETSRELFDGITSGWIRLLTALPPAGGAGNLLTVPFFCGLVGGFVTILTARLVRPSICVVVPLAVLAASVLMGTDEPSSLVLQGVVFSGVTLGWIVVRSHRGGSGFSTLNASKVGAVVGLLAVTAAGGAWLGPRMPGADTSDRFVLRDDVVPPFDPLLEPSPLAGFRRYTGVKNEPQTVMTVDGLPSGTLIRLATMDLYDQLVWKSSGDGSPLGGSFVRVGEELPSTSDGRTVSAEITIERPHGVWLPTVGDVSVIEFTGESRAVAESLRFNLETETAAVVGRVGAGTTYRIEAVVPDSVEDEIGLSRADLDRRYASRNPADVPAPVRALADELVGDATTPYDQITAIADEFRAVGAYSDGGRGAEPPTPPGHSIARLVQFLDASGGEFVGNGEQYAAALALMAQARSIPARLVMGFEVGATVNTVGDTVVKGEDVRAWVEIPLADVGWVPVPVTPPRTNLPNPSPEPQPRVLNPEPQPPPPTVPPPPADAPAALGVEDPASEDIEEDDEDPVDTGTTIPWYLIVVAVAVALLVVPMLVVLGLKARRRRRRRRRGPPEARVAAAWQDVVDQSRDLGCAPPAAFTRSEAAQFLQSDAAEVLAARSDVIIFGADEPTNDHADEMWTLADDAREELRSQHGSITRARAAVGRASLRS